MRLLAPKMTICITVLLGLRHERGAGGQDVTREIRTPEMSDGASKVSAHGPVRGILLANSGNALSTKYGNAIPIPTITISESPIAAG